MTSELLRTKNRPKRCTRIHEYHLILTQTLPYTYDSPRFTCVKAELQRLNDASNVP